MPTLSDDGNDGDYLNKAIKTYKIVANATKKLAKTSKYSKHDIFVSQDFNEQNYSYKTTRNSSPKQLDLYSENREYSSPWNYKMNESIQKPFDRKRSHQQCYNYGSETTPFHVSTDAKIPSEMFLSPCQNSISPTKP